MIAALSRAPARRNPSTLLKNATVVTGTPWTRGELSSYCERLLDIASVEAGDAFALELQDRDQQPLAQALADACARRGVVIEVLCQTDNIIAAGQVEQAVAARGVLMSVQSYRPPGSDDEEPGPAHEEVDVFAAYDKALNRNELRWNIAVCPTRAWARSVYPELDADSAFRVLGEDLRSFVRNGADDKPDAWQQHMRTLRRRAEIINARGVHLLRLQSPGTDLRLSVLEGARFLPVEWETRYGQRVCVNAPTEEIFTTPDPAKVEGRFMTTKPLVLAGEIISHISGRIVAGQLTELRTPNPKHEKLLRAVFLDGDPSVRRLGELGLVDAGSRIGERNRIYHNSIIDENTGTHLGFGQSYEAALGADALAAGVSGNRSETHIDLIIGTPEMKVTGVADDGQEMALIERGRWVL